MSRVKIQICAVAALGVTALTPTAAASPAQTPPPTAGSPSCNGLVVTFENQDSGLFGASGNPNSSAGPGYFLRSDSPAAIAAVREEFCS